MNDRKPTAFPVLMKNDTCSLIQATDDVYQIRFSNRAANAYLVRGSARTILIDVGLSSNYPAMAECLNFIGCPAEKIDMVVLSHEASRPYRRRLALQRAPHLRRRPSPRRKQDHAARRLLDAAKDVQRAERADQRRHLA
ncbi:hypothetical protein ACVWXO_004198 [Bradyrhizobium sp. LM2.7]